MNDSDKPEDQDGLEKHIQLNWDELKPDLKSESAPELSPTESQGPRELGFARQMYQDLLDVLTEPTSFFTERYPQVLLSYAFAFGIIVKWISSFLDWLIRAIRHETLLDGFMRMREKLQELPFWKEIPDTFWAQGGDHSQTNLFPAWLAEMLSIALSPFQSLIHFCVWGFVLSLGGYFMISKKDPQNGARVQDPIEIAQFIKLSCFASAPCLIASALGFLPFGIDSLIGTLYTLSLLILGMTIRFKISSLRAIAVMILPWIMSLIAIGALLLVFGVLIFALFASLFHS